MYALIITFYIALIGMIIMVLTKRREISSGRATVLSRLGRSSDHFFHMIFGAVRRGVSYINKHTFIAVAQWIAFHVLLRVRRIYVEAKDRALSNPHSRKVIDAVRGRGEISREGASFYLRRISDRK